MWLWPLANPLRYSPAGYIVAIIWNVCELARVPCPFAPWAFGAIIGRRPHRKE